MCAAIEETPTSGRRALTQLMRAARLNGSGSAAAPSATSSQIVGRPAVLIPHANPGKRGHGRSKTREHAFGVRAQGCVTPGSWSPPEAHDPEIATTRLRRAGCPGVAESDRQGAGSAGPGRGNPPCDSGQRTGPRVTPAPPVGELDVTDPSAPVNW